MKKTKQYIQKELYQKTFDTLINKLDEEKQQTLKKLYNKILEDINNENLKNKK